MKTLMQQFPQVKSGSVISAVDLIKGIGIYAGLESIEVEGATGLYNTNYEGKAAAAINELRKKDFVFLHVEASDEAGHEGDVPLKVRTIEYLDSRIVGPIYEEVKTWDEPVTIVVLPDHPTYCRIRTHVKEPVPFLIYKPGVEADAVEVYSEAAAKGGSYGLLRDNEFINAVFA
jgi:2,3-bisphosphoglycerate-independent phosphoglycerate mutase